MTVGGGRVSGPWDVWMRLFGLVLEEGDEVVAVLGLLEATEGHLGAGDVLLGVLEVIEEGVLVPGDTLLLVGVGV